MWKGMYHLMSCMSCMNCTNWVKGIKRLNQGRRVNNDICSERCLVSTPRRNLYVWLRVALVSFCFRDCFGLWKEPGRQRDTGNCGLPTPWSIFDPRDDSGSAYRISSWRVELHPKSLAENICCSFAVFGDF